MVGVPDGVHEPPDPVAPVAFDEHAVRARTEAATRAAKCGGRNLRDMRTPSDRPVQTGTSAIWGSVSGGPVNRKESGSAIAMRSGVVPRASGHPVGPWNALRIPLRNHACQ